MNRLHTQSRNVGESPIPWFVGRFLLALVLWMIALMIATPKTAAATVPVKDLVQVEGIRDNQLVGYGLVVGLAGTGDRFQTQFTAQTIRNLLDRMGVSVPQINLQVRNTAAVIVTATLPPFARPGLRLDATVGALGDATNLQGGLLLLTALRGPDGAIYALAQGPLATGGFVAGLAQTGNTLRLNHPNTARVPNGAIDEAAAPSFMPREEVTLLLRQADFTTASNIATAINAELTGTAGATANATPPNTPAVAEHAGLVRVQIPEAERETAAAFLARLEEILVESAVRARIVVNERTGTIVMGGQVAIDPVAIMHGSLSVEVATTFQVSQPNPFGRGETEVVPESTVDVNEEKPRSVTLEDGATVEDLLRALNAVGVSARDIISILQSIKAAGALKAELEII
jgi:flagellar P-ring protein precursor FlgI